MLMLVGPICALAKLDLKPVMGRLLDKTSNKAKLIATRMKKWRFCTKIWEDPAKLKIAAYMQKPIKL
jgi:hypothetical protein